MVLSRLTKITGPGVATDTNWVGNNADFTGITTTATSFNIGVTTFHSTLAEVHNIKSTGIITATGGSFSGNVTAVDGTFSGNVSIAGTLTYEDVTNIDSVGIITAPALDVDDFLDVGSNIKLGNAGVITATSFVGSGAALTGIDATAIKDSGGNVKIQAQASGAVYTGIHTFNSDLDVDGHTNLDNVSIAGVVTATSFSGAIELSSDSSPQLGGDLDTNGFDINLDANKYLTFGPITSGGQIYHTNAHFYMWNDTGNIYIQNSGTSTNEEIHIRAKGGENSIRAIANGAVELYYDNSKKLHTVTNGIDVTGMCTDDGARHDGDVYFIGGTSGRNAVWDMSDNALEFADNAQARFGNDNDLALFHDGSHSHLQNGTGDLRITGNRIELRSYTGGENYFTGDVNGAAKLYYDNALKLETSAKGIQVGTGVTIETNGQATYTGIVTASSFKLSDGSAVGGVTSDATYNTIGGTGAGNALTSNARDNTFFGHEAGNDVTSGDYNSIFGAGAGELIDTGGYNTCIGADAGRKLQNGSKNTLVGRAAGKTLGQSNSNVEGCVMVGDEAGTQMINGYYNVFVGHQAAQHMQSGRSNVCVGYLAGQGTYNNCTGQYNTAIGEISLYTLQSGSYNHVMGRYAGHSITTGSYNICIGDKSGAVNTYAGNSGDLTTGSNNIIIGKEAQASSATVSNEITLGDANIDKFRVPGLGLEFAKDHTYGVVGGRKNWFDNGSFDCTYGGRKANVSMDYGNHHAYGWVTDRFMSRNAVQWSRSSNVPTGKGFSYSTLTNGAGGTLMQAVELPDYGDMGVFTPGSYWCVSVWSTAGLNHSTTAFSYDLGSTKTDIPGVGSGTYATTGETASGTSTGTFNRYYRVYGPMPSSIISTATAAYWTWGFSAQGYATGFQLERVPTSTSKPTPYEHVHPSVTINRCRRYAYRKYNSRHVSGWKRHDANVNWEARHPVLPTHMPSGSNQSADPYGIHMHTAGMLTNFQSIWQNPAVTSLSRYGFNPADGSFILNGQSNYSGTHIVIPSYEGFEYEVQHGFF